MTSGTRYEFWLTSEDQLRQQRETLLATLAEILKFGDVRVIVQPLPVSEE